MQSPTTAVQKTTKQDNSTIGDLQEIETGNKLHCTNKESEIWNNKYNRFN